MKKIRCWSHIVVLFVTAALISCAKSDDNSASSPSATAQGAQFSDAEFKADRESVVTADKEMVKAGFMCERQPQNQNRFAYNLTTMESRKQDASAPTAEATRIAVEFVKSGNKFLSKYKGTYFINGSPQSIDTGVYENIGGCVALAKKTFVETKAP